MSRSVGYGGTTYVVQRQGWVKIGSALYVKQRLAALRKGGVKAPPDMNVAEPLTVVAMIDGRTVERELHRRYAEHRVEGEWFHAAPVLADLEERGILA